MRLLASLDDEDRFRLSPGGKLALQDSTLFAYGVLMMGCRKGEEAYTNLKTLAIRLKNYKMYQLVVINIYMIIYMTEEIELSKNYPQSMIYLVNLLKNKIQYMAGVLDILQDCEAVHAGVKNYYNPRDKKINKRGL